MLEQVIDRVEPSEPDSFQLAGARERYHENFRDAFFHLSGLGSQGYPEKDREKMLVDLHMANRLVIIESSAEDEITPFPININLQNCLEQVYQDVEVIPEKLEFSPHGLNIRVGPKDRTNMDLMQSEYLYESGPSGESFHKDLEIDTDNYSIHALGLGQPKHTVVGYLKPEQMDSISKLLYVVSRRAETFIEIVQAKYRA